MIKRFGELLLHPKILTNCCIVGEKHIIYKIIFILREYFLFKDILSMIIKIKKKNNDIVCFNLELLLNPYFFLIFTFSSNYFYYFY